MGQKFTSPKWCCVIATCVSTPPLTYLQPCPCCLVPEIKNKKSFKTYIHTYTPCWPYDILTIYMFLLLEKIYTCKYILQHTLQHPISMATDFSLFSCVCVCVSTYEVTCMFSSSAYAKHLVERAAFHFQNGICCQ